MTIAPTALTVDPQDTQKIEANLKTQIEEWKKNPFMPHLVARLRPSAYQWYTFFAYLDVLISWGDQLFRRDTRESVNEATLLYVLAAKLLGPRPRVIHATVQPPALTYRSLLANSKGFDDFSDAWLHYADLPGIKQLSGVNNGGSQSIVYAMKRPDQKTSQNSTLYTPSGLQTLTSLGILAFCIPQNDKVTGYYDLIGQRLDNVRNCRNIEGVFRELPPYDPPIDPLLLIRARAAGLDIEATIADLRDAPLPNYRFSFTLQKALEVTAELKALGSALLAAFEKGDAEELALLRSSQEIAMLNLVREIRQKQVDEADANLLALQQSEETLLERFGQYQKLLGKPGITSGQDGLPVVEQTSSLSVFTDPVGTASGLGLSSLEIQQLLHTALSNELHQQASAVHVVAGILAAFPNIFAGTPFAGQTSGGTNWGIALTALAQAIEIAATEETYLANLAGTFGSYQRRQDEWVHQSKLALAELKQLRKQIVAAEIRKAIAQQERDNHDKQIENAQAVDEFMHGKFTNQQLHRWMSAQIAEVYFRTYQLAFDQAKRAERAFQFELGLDSTVAPFVQSDHWESLKRGLLAGERLHYDLKRMENAYLERNTREFELTKHVSLLQLNPLALVTLRETGKCTVTLPEELFDLDYPGHYFRRIKSVSLTLPCVAGPYTTIPCTLRLSKHRIRISSLNADTAEKYPPYFDDKSVIDSRFVEEKNIPIPVTAIATSSAQNDSGMFELNFRDERYLPFEGAGVISEWSLELFNDDTNQADSKKPSDFGKPLRQFDYGTISDVILHIRYTAREGAGTFKKGAIDHLNTYFMQDMTTPAFRLFNLRQEFPTQWHRFLYPANAATGNVFELEMSSMLFPWRDNGKKIKINTLSLLARSTNKEADYTVVVTPPATNLPDLARTIILTSNSKFGELRNGVKSTTDHKPLFDATIDLAASTKKWQFTMTGPNGKLNEDAETKKMEVEDLILIFGYEWESGG